MCNAKGVACQALQQVTFESFARGESDGMHEPVEAAPLGVQIFKQLGDLRFVSDITRQHRRRAEVFRQIDHAVFEFLTLIGESQRGTLAVRGARNAISDGAVGQQAGDENFFVLQQGHERSFIDAAIIPSVPGRLTRAGAFGYTGAR